MATGQQAEPQVAKLMDPVCGLRVAPQTAAGRSEYRGRTYFFHSAACKSEFDAAPARFAERDAEIHPGTAPAPPADVAPEPMLIDPVCGRRVEDRPDAPRATFDGVTYVFCSEECRREFLHKPERFVSSLSYEPDRHAAG